MTGCEARLDAIADRRGDRRGRTVLAARLLYGPGHRLGIDVRLRDLSEAGARAVLPPGEACPPAGVLIVGKTGMAHAARAAWTGAGEAGLSFASALDLKTQGLAGEALGLRRLWLELTSR